MEPPHVHTLTLSGILYESKRIVGSNHSHFLTLSLFFFPLSLSLIIDSPTLHHHFTSPDHHHFSTTDHHHFTALNHLLYILTIITLTLIATATITHSTHHTFLNNPTNPIASLSSTFFPLLSTTIITYTLLSLFSLSFLILSNLFLISLQSLGWFVFVVDYTSTKFICFSVVLGFVFFVFLMYFYVNWSLACVVAVVESKWGFASLMRSAYLVKGMRTVSLKLMLFYGVIGGTIAAVYSRLWLDYGLTGWGVFFVLVGSSFLMMLLMQSTAANVVLYNYCRALHGELALEIDDDGFVNEYVGLSADDEKVPHVVTVVTV